MIQRPRLITNQLICDECLRVMKTLLDNSIDPVFGKLRYPNRCTYGIDNLHKFRQEQFEMVKGLI